jgi:hypothetical protein
MFPAGQFGTLTGPYTAFSGMRLMAPFGNEGHKNYEAPPGGVLVNHNVAVGSGTGNSSLFVNATTVYDIEIFGINWTFASGGQFFQSTGNIYESAMRDLNFYGATHVLGSTATNFGCTALTTSGQWVCSAVRGTQFHMGGSDCSFWMDGQLNINGNTVTGGAGAPLIWLDSMQKAMMGYVFVTAENDWGGLRVSSASGTPLERANKFFGGSFEGRGTTNVATRPVIDMQGGMAVFYSPWTAFVSGSSGTVNGVVQQSGGQLHIYSPHYHRATGTAATFPWFYQTGGTAHIHSPMVAEIGEQMRLRWSSGSTQTLPLPGNMVFDHAGQSLAGQLTKTSALAANDFAGYCQVGSVATDVSNGKLYICTATNGTTTSTWVSVGSQT